MRHLSPNDYKTNKHKVLICHYSSLSFTLSCVIWPIPPNLTCLPGFLCIEFLQLSCFTGSSNLSSMDLGYYYFHIIMKNATVIPMAMFLLTTESAKLEVENYYASRSTFLRKCGCFSNSRGFLKKQKMIMGTSEISSFIDYQFRRSIKFLGALETIVCVQCCALITFVRTVLM